MKKAAAELETRREQEAALRSQMASLADEKAILTRALDRVIERGEDLRDELDELRAELDSVADRRELCDQNLDKATFEALLAREQCRQVGDDCSQRVTEHREHGGRQRQESMRDLRDVRRELVAAQDMAIQADDERKLLRLEIRRARARGREVEARLDASELCEERLVARRRVDVASPETREANREIWLRLVDLRREVLLGSMRRTALERRVSELQERLAERGP